MKSSVYLATCFLLVCGMSSAEGQTQAGENISTPHLFAPGVVSTPDFEYNTSFTPDGKTVFFSRADPGYNHITILESHLRGKRWSEPKVASFSGIWKDADAHVTPDGKKVFFVSNRPSDGSRTPRKDYNIWYVETKANGEWGAPQHLGGPINTESNEAYPSPTTDGTLYFEASRSAHPGTHIYRSRMVKGEYSEPELLSFANKANDINPAVASDGSFLIFSSRDRGGLGSSDLFISFPIEDGHWSDPVNLGPAINSPFGDTAPALSPDNRKLYFASNRINTPIIPTTPITFKELEVQLHSIQNGLLNIYEVDLGDLRRFTAK